MHIDIDHLGSDGGRTNIVSQSNSIYRLGPSGRKNLPFGQGITKLVASFSGGLTNVAKVFSVPQNIRGKNSNSYNN